MVPLDLAEIGLDSNCLTFIVDAFEGIEEPTDDLAAQKVALARCYLYTPGTLWTLPTVKREFERIADPARRAKHVSWTSVLFGVRPLQDPVAMKRRALDLLVSHDDIDDCMVLAEAEDVGLSVLLTFDNNFVQRLGPRTRLRVDRPASFWASLGIPRGAAPLKLPWPDNPLAAQVWWRW